MRAFYSELVEHGEEFARQTADRRIGEVAWEDAEAVFNQWVHVWAYDEMHRVLEERLKKTIAGAKGIINSILSVRYLSRRKKSSSR